MEANKILQIPISNDEEEDLICWQGTKDGNYSVRSGYNAQMEWETAQSGLALKPAITLKKLTLGKNFGRLKLPLNSSTYYGGLCTMLSLPK
jgi:hypothetical protein